MIRATKVQGQHRWTHAAADTVVLDFDDRHRRRMAMTGTRGLEFLLDLENAIALRGACPIDLGQSALILPAMLKIGRYIAMSTTPTVPPMPTIMMGSMRLVSAATATSTSSS